MRWGWRVAGDRIEEWGEMREDGAREQTRATGGKMCEEICGEEGWRQGRHGDKREEMRGDEKVKRGMER